MESWVEEKSAITIFQDMELTSLCGQHFTFYIFIKFASCLDSG